MVIYLVFSRQPVPKHTDYQHRKRKGAGGLEDAPGTNAVQSTRKIRMLHMGPARVVGIVLKAYFLKRI